MTSNFQTQNGAFINVKFTPKISHGTQYISDFKTSITKSKSSLETRMASQPRVSKVFNINLSRLKLDEVADIQSFFAVVKGSLNSFRFNDETDNKATNQPLLSTNTAKTTFQLIKLYKVIDQASNIKSTYKLITKPIASSVEIFSNGVKVSSSQYSLDDSSGIIAFQSPQNEDTLSANFNFDTHVRFDTESLIVEHSNDGYKLSNPIKIIEIIDG